MLWQRALFKGQKVWAAVRGPGALLDEGGRVAIRYAAKEGATVYQAGASRVALDPDEAPVALPFGVDAEPSSGEKAGGARKAGGSGRKAGSGFGSAGSRTAAQAALANDAFKRLLAELPAEVARAFTDGGCKGNPGPAGSGAVVELPDGRVGEACLSLGRATNNIAELSAIGLALDLLEQAQVSRGAKIALFTDSSYANGVLTQGWKAKANTELIRQLRARLEGWPRLKVHWVAGHVGIPGNERADVLANDGIRGLTRATWRDPQG